MFDDEWIRSLTEAEVITTDILEVQVTQAAQGETWRDEDVDNKKVRRTQMGYCLRKYVSRRLLALSEGEIAALMTAMRKVGVGSQGGSKALNIFQELIIDEWMADLENSLGANQSG